MGGDSISSAVSKLTVEPPPQVYHRSPQAASGSAAAARDACVASLRGPPLHERPRSFPYPIKPRDTMETVGAPRGRHLRRVAVERPPPAPRPRCPIRTISCLGRTLRAARPRAGPPRNRLFLRPFRWCGGTDAIADARGSRRSFGTANVGRGPPRGSERPPSRLIQMQPHRSPIAAPSSLRDGNLRTRPWEDECHGHPHRTSRRDTSSIEECFESGREGHTSDHIGENLLVELLSGRATLTATDSAQAWRCSSSALAGAPGRAQEGHDVQWHPPRAPS